LRWLAALLLVVGACGRFGFDSRAATDPDAGDPGVDATLDGPAANPDAIPASACGSFDSVLCDGFEAGLSDWSATVAGGLIEIVDTPTFRGNGALKATTPAAGAIAQITQAHAPITTGTLYMRAYYFFPSSTATVGQVELSNTGDDSDVHTHIGMDLDTPILLVNNLTNGGSAITRDTWLCFELKILIDAAGRAELRIDGGAMMEIDANTIVPGGYTDTSVGIYSTSGVATGNYELYVDEVAVSDTPIGCL